MLLHRAKSVRPSPTTQRGAALIVSLILLAVITLVGLAAIGTTILQNEAAANSYDREIAFQSAEAALAQAQVAITNATATLPAPAGFEDCSTPVGGTAANTVCAANPFDDLKVPSADVVSVPASAFGTSPAAAAGVPPQYVVQYVGRFVAPPPNATANGGSQRYGQPLNNDAFADYYRITARSGDPTKESGRAIVTLQSMLRN